MKRINYLLTLLTLSVGMGCAKPLTPWAVYNQELDGSRSPLPLDEAYFRPDYNQVGLIGLDHFGYGESRAVYYLADSIGAGSVFYNHDDQLLPLKIEGEPSDAEIGIVCLKANRLFYYLSLKRFYCRALYNQALLLRSTDGNYLFRIEAVQSGFNLDDFKTRSIYLNSPEIRQLSVTVQKLAYNELQLLHKDLSAKQISNANYQKHQQSLTDLLANFSR